MKAAFSRNHIKNPRPHSPHLSLPSLYSLLKKTEACPGAQVRRVLPDCGHFTNTPSVGLTELHKPECQSVFHVAQVTVGLADVDSWASLFDSIILGFGVYSYAVLIN